MNKEIKKYFGLTLFAVLVIAIYKTWNTEFIGTFFNLLTPLFIGIILAYLLCFPSKKIESLLNKIPLKPVKKISRLFSIIIVYALLLICCYVLVSRLAPTLISNLYDIVSQLPNAFSRLILYIKTHNFMGYSLNTEELLDSLSSVISVDMILSYLNLESIMGYIHGIVSVSGTLMDIFIGIIISIYLILDREDFFRFGKKLSGCLFKPALNREVQKYFRKINEFIIRYIYCRLIDALIMFFVSLFALLIFRIPYAPALAAIVAVFNIVPYIGSILSTIILILVTLFTGGINSAVLVGVMMFILQQIDGNVIAPFLVKDKLKINPVVVLVAVILGGGYGGILGIMIGVPLFAVIRLLVNDLMRRHEIVEKYKARHGGKLPSAYFDFEKK